MLKHKELMLGFAVSFISVWSTQLSHELYEVDNAPCRSVTVTWEIRSPSTMPDENITGKVSVIFDSNSVEVELPLKRIDDAACTRIFSSFQHEARIHCVRTLFQESPLLAFYDIEIESISAHVAMSNIFDSDAFTCDTSKTSIAIHGAVVDAKLQCDFHSQNSYRENTGIGTEDQKGICNVNTSTLSAALSELYSLNASEGFDKAKILSQKLSDSLHGGIRLHHDNDIDPLLYLASTNKDYSGSFIELNLTEQNHNMHHKTSYGNILDAYTRSISPGRPPSKKSIFSIRNDGYLQTSGNIDTIDGASIQSSGALLAQTKLVLGSTRVTADLVILVPSSHSYAIVQSNGKYSVNIYTICTKDAIIGQVLVVQNRDEEKLEGSVVIAPGSAAMFVFDGVHWITSTMSMRPYRETKIIGKSTKNEANRVALYGERDELLHDQHFKYNRDTLTLSVDSIEVKDLRGRIRMSHSELHDVEIIGGHISRVNMTSIGLMEVSGELLVDSPAYFADGITVRGHVFSSASYVDASDRRFKKNIELLHELEALLIVKRLEAVEYELIGSSSSKREIGYIAQDLEKILPFVVTEDDKGYKYVAYSRIVPILSEAIKALTAQVQQYEEKVSFMQTQIDDLRAHIRSQQ